MKYYRALKDLSNGYKQHQPVPASALKAAVIPILLEKGAIAEVAGPPLYVLPGWKVRAEKLAFIGVTMVHEFLEHDVQELATTMGVRIATIEKWEAELVRWLVPAPAQALEQATGGRRRR